MCVQDVMIARRLWYRSTVLDLSGATGVTLAADPRRYRLWIPLQGDGWAIYMGTSADTTKLLYMTPLNNSTIPVMLRLEEYGPTLQAGLFILCRGNAQAIAASVWEAVLSPDIDAITQRGI